MSTSRRIQIGVLATVFVVMALSALGVRQLEAEDGAFALLALKLDFRSHPLEQKAANAEPEAGALHGPSPRFLDSDEAIEDVLPHI